MLPFESRSSTFLSLEPPNQFSFHFSWLRYRVTENDQTLEKALFYNPK